MRKLYTATTFLAIFVLWLFVSFKANPLFVPSPIAVWNDFLILVQTGQIFVHLFYTFRRIMLATIISGITSLALGLLIRNSKIARATIYPLAMVLRYVPVTAFYPLLIIWVGIGEEMKVSFLFIACFVYMLPSVVQALEEVNEQVIDTGRTIGMSKLQVITMIQLPSALPSILSGFITMVGIGWTYCAVVETVNANYGLGYVIHQGTSRGHTDIVFMAIIVIMAVSFVFDNVCRTALRKCFKWRYINDKTK